MRNIYSSEQYRSKRQTYTAIGASIMGSVLVSISVLLIKFSKSVGSESSFLVGLCGSLYCLALVCLKPKSNSASRQNLSYDKEITLEEKTDSNSVENGNEHAKRSDDFYFAIKDVILLLLLGAVFSGGYAHFYFVALKYTTMGDTFAVCLTVHFVSNVVLESIALKKIPHILTLFAGLLGLIGMFLICQPENLLKLQFDVKYTTGVGFATMSGISGTLYYCGLQKFKNVPESLAHLSYFIGPLIYCCPEILLVNKFHFSMCDTTLRLYAVVASVFYVLGAILCVVGSQLSLPSISTLLKLLMIVLGYIFQIVFLAEPTSLSSTFGGILTLASILVQCFVMICLK